MVSPDRIEVSPREPKKLTAIYTTHRSDLFTESQESNGVFLIGHATGTRPPASSRRRREKQRSTFLSLSLNHPGFTESFVHESQP